MGSDDAKPRKTLKDVIRNFIPAWFAVNMGTGAISIIFHGYPYGTDTHAMKILTLVFFFMNLILFLIFLTITIARYIMFPDIWTLMLHHPVQSLFLGTFPMGAATIITIATNSINAEYGFGGKSFLYFLWAMWWLDVAVSVFCCWGMMHYMKVNQKHAVESMTAVWLLPVVTLIVASSTGGVIAPVLQTYSPHNALITMAVSLVLVSIGLSLALMMLTIYLLRLIVYGLPPSATIISVFLPLGPTGQAGYSIILIGDYFKSTLPLKYGSSELLTSSMAGDMIYVICVGISFVLWSLATMWLIFAVLSIQNIRRRSRIPFKVPFWGLIFPNGVYANLTVKLASEFDSSFFRVFGAIYGGVTILMWLAVASRTLLMSYSREIFEAPCLQDIDIARPNNAPDQTCAVNQQTPCAQKQS